MKLALILLSWLLFTSIYGSGQGMSCHRSTAGTDFWIGFMPNDYFKLYYQNVFTPLNYCEIMVTSELDADFNITLGHLEIPFGGPYHVNAGSSLKIKFDWEKVDKTAVHLTSVNNPVRVYALNFSEYSSDISVIYPTSILGNEYYMMDYDGSPEGISYCIQERGLPSCHYYSTIANEFLIIAGEDNTNVLITFPDGSQRPIAVQLGRGDQYVKQGLYTWGIMGVHIESNRPLAFFSGWTHTSIPSGTTGAVGHLYEQNPPVQSWGKKIIAVPFKGRCQDYWSILASENNTKIQIGNGIPFYLNKGFIHKFSLTQWEPSIIQSDKPVLLAQFSGANPGQCGSNSNQASMVIISPVNQGTEKVVFTTYEFIPFSHIWESDLDPDGKYIYTYSHEKTDTSNCQYYINVIVKDDAAGKILLDGSTINFQSLNLSGCSYAQIKISRGDHVIESTESGKGFVAYAYNYWGSDTRSYGLGSSLDLTLDLAAANHTGPARPVNWCWGDTLRAGNYFENYRWKTGETTSYMVPDKSGWYGVEVSTTQACRLKDSIELLIHRPVVELGNDGVICKGDGRVLDAGGWFAEYKWSTQETVQKITVFQPGLYSVAVRDSFGCKAGDSIRLSLDEKPKISFPGQDTLICGKKNTLLNIQTDKGSITAERLYDNHLFANLNVDVPEYGSYRFKITATDDKSCSEDSVISIGFHQIPSVGFSVDSMKCYGYNLTAVYIGNADIDRSEFTWIFRGDTLIKAIAADSVLIPLGTGRMTRELKLIVTDKGCSNDKTLGNIKVIPALQMRAADSTGCVPLTARFFTDPGPAEYTWDFGDGTAVVHTANPVHTFNNPGIFGVRLKVKSDQGCTNEVNIDSMIFAAPNPTAAFSMDSRTMPDSRHEVQFVNESTGAIGYSWDFGDGTTSEEMSPSHTYPDFAEVTILLRASNEYECVDTFSGTLLFKFDQIYPPNAFSPNAPNEADREFRLTADGVNSDGYHFVIISRWNDIVFETRNEIKGWDGRMKSGDYAPAGNYVWILDYNDFIGRSHRQTGTVTLVY